MIRFYLPVALFSALVVFPCCVAVEKEGSGVESRVSLAMTGTNVERIAIYFSADDRPGSSVRNPRLTGMMERSRIAKTARTSLPLNYTCIEDEFIKQLIAAGYQVPSRSDNREILAELERQHSDHHEDQYGVLGRFLNVDAILVLRCELRSFGEESTISARLLDVETSELLWVASLTRKEMTPNELASLVAATLPGREGMDVRTQKDQSRGKQAALSASRFVGVSDGILDLVVGRPKTTAVFCDSTVKSYERIALVTRKTKYLDPRRAEDEAMPLLMQKGYRVPSRSDVESVLEEMKFQVSDITDDDVTEIGRILNVPAILLITPTLVQRTNKPDQPRRFAIGIGVRLIDVNESRIAYVSTSYRGISDDSFEHHLLMGIRYALSSMPSRIEH